MQTARGRETAVAAEWVAVKAALNVSPGREYRCVLFVCSVFVVRYGLLIAGDNFRRTAAAAAAAQHNSNMNIKNCTENKTLHDLYWEFGGQGCIFYKNLSAKSS